MGQSCHRKTGVASQADRSETLGLRCRPPLACPLKGQQTAYIDPPVNRCGGIGVRKDLP